MRRQGERGAGTKLFVRQRHEGEKDLIEQGLPRHVTPLVRDVKRACKNEGLEREYGSSAPPLHE